MEGKTCPLFFFSSFCLSGPRWNSVPRSRVTSCSYCCSKGFIANLSVQRQFFPTDEDELGAAKALMRLQDTYKLDTATISRGELPGNSPLQALHVSFSGWTSQRPVEVHCHCWW
jgi:hypothetical protein